MATTATLTIDDGKVTLTVSDDADVNVVRRTQPDASVVTAVAPRDWEAVVEQSRYAALEREFCRRAQDRDWIVERARSVGPHANDVSVYPPPGSPRVRIAAFYGPSARIAFHNRVEVEDAEGREGVAAVYDHRGKPNQKFAGLRIRLRQMADVDTAIELAELINERIID